MGAVNRSCGCSKPDSTIDFFVPIFTIFQFLFLMGWLKVAMCVMNPFGDDDEDFQTSEILDYNLEISRRSASADEMMFPFDFKLPDMKTKPQPQAEADNLPEFLARMSIEMERTHRELLVEMSEPVGLTRVGISGGVIGGGGGGCCCWGDEGQDESFIHSYSRDVVAMDSRQPQLEVADGRVNRSKRTQKRRQRRSKNCCGVGGGGADEIGNDGDDGDGCGAAAFVAKNCHASVAAASSSGVSWDRQGPAAV
ncbi:hypothetical protein BOX15_Mlig016098g3 [Macrostomum lignano]|uniref:Bestrophin homolog n=2 Tax=Macrostomum lignano TaxID=282301 RepID=A0A267FN49_9PLAT|nr:hypothetical protein BOX15_Mlig016098g3 [Macrostomum lignano]